MSRLVPAVVHDAVIEIIGNETEASDWEHLAQADKTAMIGRWVVRADVGGVLRPLLGSDAEIRVWVKEVGLKKRRRSSLLCARDVVDATLGAGLKIDPARTGDKPPHCVADGPAGPAYLCWDRPVNAKHLIWAAVTALEDHHDLSTAMVVFIDTVAERTTPDRRVRLERLACRCGVSVRWIEP